MARKKKVRAKTARADTLRILVNRLARKDDAIALLRTAANVHNRLLFVNVALASATELHLQDLPKCADLFAELVRWITRNPCASILSDAVNIFQGERQRNRKLHRFLVDRLGLCRSTGQSWLQSLPKYSLDRLSRPYPPLGYCVSESPEIADKWEHFLLRDPQPDPRQPRRPIHSLDADALQLEVPGDESCVIVDADDGSTVAVVLRGIMQEGDQVQTELLSWAVETIQNGIAGRRSIRVSITYKYFQTMALIVVTFHC